MIENRKKTQEIAPKGQSQVSCNCARLREAFCYGPRRLAAGQNTLFAVFQDGSVEKG